MGGSNRWKGKDPSTIRDKRISLALTQSELDSIDAKAEATGISRAELIVRAVREYEGRA